VPHPAGRSVYGVSGFFFPCWGVRSRVPRSVAARRFAVDNAREQIEDCEMTLCSLLAHAQGRRTDKMRP
jgi:hypothetical protein